MSEALRVLGMRLLAGRIGGIYARRSEQVRRALGPLLGPGPGKLRALPELRAGDPPAALVKLRPGARHRPAVLHAAQELLLAAARGDAGAVTRLTHDRLTVLWPEGQLGPHAGPEVAAYLAARGEPAPAPSFERARAYTPAEIRSALPRGLPEAVELALSAGNGFWVSGELRTSSGQARVLLVLGADAEGRWRAHNLPVPALDQAHLSGPGVHAHEDGAVRAAEQLVRHLVLGHPRPLRSLRNHMLDQVVLGGAPAPVEALWARAAEGAERLAEAETVFLGAELVPLSSWPGWSALARRAVELWRRPVEKLQLQLVQVRLATLDEESGAPAHARAAFALMIGVKDKKDSPTRFRLGALELP